MAANAENKVVTLKDLIAAHQKGNEKVNALAERVDALAETGGEPNVITTINVNGTVAAVENKTVEITVPTKVSDIANDSKYQTEDQVVASINAKIASTYKAGGSVAFAALPELTEANLGLVVNVTDKFTTTADFVEGAGNKHPTGTNVVVVQAGEDYKYDVLSGFVDLSGLVEKEAGKGLSEENFTAAEKEKLAGIEFATDEEVEAALAEIYGE